MKADAIAMIRWLPHDRGGRSSPSAARYRAAARFEDARDRWPEAVWSLVVDPIRSFGRPTVAALCDVQFLADEAPAELLNAGARFELCEGRRVVAKGVVLPANVEAPPQIDDFALALMG